MESTGKSKDRFLVAILFGCLLLIVGLFFLRPEPTTQPVIEEEYENCFEGNATLANPTNVSHDNSLWYCGFAENGHRYCFRMLPCFRK